MFQAPFFHPFMPARQYPCTLRFHGGPGPGSVAALAHRYARTPATGTGHRPIVPPPFKGERRDGIEKSTLSTVRSSRSCRHGIENYLGLLAPLRVPPVFLLILSCLHFEERLFLSGQTCPFLFLSFPYTDLLLTPRSHSHERTPPHCAPARR